MANLKSPSMLLVANTTPTGSATGNPRNKVALKPGRSLMNWIRLGHSGKDLTGVGGKILEVSPQELATHNRPDDAWIALKGVVYNVSHYMEYHPGGQDELMRGVGKDATHLFNEVHQWVNAESMLQKCVVGKLTSLPIPATLFATPAIPINPRLCKKEPNTTVDVTDSAGANYRPCTLSSKRDITHNTRLFKLRLPADSSLLSIPTGHHVHLRATVQGTEICRSYTPVPPRLHLARELLPEVDDTCSLNLMIKIYADGALTPHLDSLAIGDTIEVSDAIGSFRDEQWQPRRSLVLLAAGTGFTPMAGLLLAALSQPDRTVKLLLFNRQERDIPWRKQLEALAEEDPRFEVVHVFSEGGNGNRILNVGLLRDALAGTDSGSSGECVPAMRSLVAVCGPPAFTQLAARTLDEIGVQSDDIHVFDG